MALQPIDPRRSASQIAVKPSSIIGQVAEGLVAVDDVLRQRASMDARKSQTSTETLPLLNLMFMQGGKLRFEETR